MAIDRSRTGLPIDASRTSSSTTKCNGDLVADPRAAAPATVRRRVGHFEYTYGAGPRQRGCSALVHAPIRRLKGDIVYGTKHQDDVCGTESTARSTCEEVPHRPCDATSWACLDQQ